MDRRDSRRARRPADPRGRPRGAGGRGRGGRGRGHPEEGGAPIRILIVTDRPRHPGGIETSLDLAVRGLREAGDEVAILTATEGGRGEGDYAARNSSALPVRAVEQIANPDAIRVVRRAQREFRPDVAYVHAFEGVLSPAAVEALRVPYVLAIANYKPVCPNALRLRADGTPCTSRQGLVCLSGGCFGAAHWLRDRPRYRWIRRVLRRAAACVTCSDAMVAALARDGVGARHVPYPVLAPGPGFARQPAERPLLVYAGRMARGKGLPVLLRALARARADGADLRLRVVGDGPEREAVVELVETLGLRDAVELRGWRSHANLDDELAEAWALVVPSVWAEPLGLVAIEGLVRGIPAVASDTGGLRETVGPLTPGLLVPPGDAAALAAKLAELAVLGPAYPLPAEQVEALRRKHDPAAHVAIMRSLFAEVAA